MHAPNPEPNPKNQEAVRQALNILKAKNPDLITPPEKTHEQQIMDRIGESAKKVHALARAIHAAAKDSGMPISAQRKSLLATLHRFWLDETMQYNEDEIRYLNALVHAHVMLESMI